MSPQISEELMILLMSSYGGLVLVLCYDVIRIFRRIFTASVFRVIAEDVIFWTAASIFMFDILLKYNYGRPRYFAIGAALGTMALFEWLIGKRMVNKVSVLLKKIMNTLLKPLKKAVKMIKLKKKKSAARFKEKVNKCPDKEEQPRPHKEDQTSKRRREKHHRRRNKELHHPGRQHQEG